MTGDVREFFKWHHGSGFAVVARGERVGTVRGITREPPEGDALLVDVEMGGATRRIALPFEAVAAVHGDEEVVVLYSRPEDVRAAPGYDPVREAPDEPYLARVRSHFRR